MKRYFKLILMTALVVLITSCVHSRSKDVKNVIFLIGDGMGLGAVSASILMEEQETGFEYATALGLQETSSANNHVTDSPAGGTALATGTRTRNGYIGIDPNGTPLTSILKKAQKMGKKTGIVVNTTLTEATPASFYAHVTNRNQGYKIAEQFVNSGVDVAIGGGQSAFMNRTDSLDLVTELRDKGYGVYLDWEKVAQSNSEKFVGILPMSQVHRRNNKPQVTRSAEDGSAIGVATTNTDDSVEKYDPREYLSLATLKALESLEKNSRKDGFFLMIESAIIDGYGHNNDTEGMLVEMSDFNNTLLLLVDYVNNHPNTLLVVTADHETGGTGVAYNQHEVGEKVDVKLNFSTKGHTGTLVPVVAYGPGAELFSGFMKNTDIPKKIESLMRNDLKTQRSNM